MKRLTRSNNKIIAGVCAGFAEYLDVDPVIIRLLWLLFALGMGTGIIVYVIAWLIIPKKK